MNTTCQKAIKKRNKFFIFLLYEAELVLSQPPLTSLRTCYVRTSWLSISYRLFLLLLIARFLNIGPVGKDKLVTMYIKISRRLHFIRYADT